MKFSKLFLTFSVVVGLGHSVSGQINEGIEVENITPDVEEVKISYPYQIQVIDQTDHIPFTITIEDPKVIEARLKSIERTMPMVYNESVEHWITFFTQRRPNFTKKMMEETGVYFPIFEKILRENGMPEELKYLSILESGLNPKAVSRSKAVGLWQFMSFTGKEYGLTINENVDERMHVEKSTDAACRYLKYLNRRFNDWDLALASYNTGQGRISRVMQKTGLSNYWDLHPHIHKDTRAYVPQFIALAYLMNFGHLHGIVPEHINSRPPLENIYVDSNVDLNVLAELTGNDIEVIKKYNPHLKTTILPESKYGYEIALPAETVPYFNDNRVAILDSASKRFRKALPDLSGSEAELAYASSDDEEGLVIGRPANLSGATKVLKGNADDHVVTTKTVKKIHKVKRGEALNVIAQKYRVSVNDIKKWNNKKSSKLIAGESLTIYVKQNEKVRNTASVAKNSSENVSSQPLYHTVKRGDTLWNISQRYEGVSIDDIKKMNNLKGNSVMIGQKIKIRS